MPNLVYSIYFTFYKYRNTDEFIKRYLDSKVNHLKDFKDKLELFYHDAIEIKSNNGDQKKRIRRKKSCDSYSSLII